MIKSNKSKEAQALHATDFDHSKKAEKRILAANGITREEAVKRSREMHLNFSEYINLIGEFA